MTLPYIQERSRQTQILAEYDVAVVGGGIAGIAAALSSARAGAKTVLLEQQYLLGGLATIGLVTIYLPLCDGEGQQVSFGIAEELLQLSVALEGKDAIADWAQKRKNGQNVRLECTYNPNLMALEAERLLQEAGVEILYGAPVCDTIVENDRITALILETRSGRSAIVAKSVVDASGDGIVVRLAGENSAVFQQQNILAAWYYATESGKYKLHPLGACDNPDKYKTNEEKAIEIVEKIWNNEKNIYCAFEEIDAEGNYIICVRDKETTRALCWYIVNIETGKAIIK